MSQDGSEDRAGSAPSDDDVRLDEVIEKYHEAQRAGGAPARDDLYAAHPDLASRLRSFFAMHDALEGVESEGGGGASLSLPSPGERIGDYEILEEIGRGGMGVVYKARQSSIGRIVALKMMSAGRFASPIEIERFRVETEAAGHLDHPNIVAIYEVGEHQGQPFFSMQYLDGGSLFEHIGEFRSRPREAARLILALARAVHHAHERQVLHRDLKPANILLDASGEPHISDFGLARLLESDESLTLTGAIIGTPGFVAPELVDRSAGKPTTAVDIYGLGAILYSLLTGEAPFHGRTPLETLDQVKNQEPSRPHSRNPLADRDLETICLKCLAKDPRRRYRSAEALADDLDRYLHGLPILARRVPTAERILK